MNLNITTALEAIKTKKIKANNLVIGILILIIIALLVFGWYYFQARRSPINFTLASPGKAYTHLFTIYEPSQLQRPMGVASSSDGRIYVADTVNHSIAVFDPVGQFLFKFGGYGKGKGQFNYPVNIAIDGSKVYIADFYNERVQVLDKKGNVLSILPSARDIEKLGGPLMPVALAHDKGGRLYVSDVNQQRIVVFDSEGNYLKTFGSAGSKPGEISYVNGIAIDDDDDGLIFLADSNNSRISVFNLDGKFVRILEKQAFLSNPKGIAFDKKSNRVYAADTLAHTIKGIDADGSLFETIGGRGLDNGFFNFPTGLCIDDQGRLYVADRENNRVQVFARE